MIQHNTHPLLHGLGQLPKVVQNASIPLDQQLRAEQDAAISSNVHSVMQRRKAGMTGTVESLYNSARKTASLQDHFSAMYWSVIAPINNIAIMETKTAYDLLCKDKKLFRQKVKMNAKVAMQRIDQYDDAVCRTMAGNMNGDRTQYWLDYSDEHYESLRHDLNIFYLTVLQVLTRYQESQKEIKARLVTSHALLRYAVNMHDTFFRKILDGWHTDMAYLFHDARLQYVLSPWMEVVDTLCQSRKPINIDDEPQVRLAFQVIERHCINLDRIRDIGDQAIALNPEVLEEKKIHNPLNDDRNFSNTFVNCFK